MSRVSGGKKAAAKLLAKDPEYYIKLGRLGGKVAPGPFKADRELARRAGRAGGKKSKRTWSKEQRANHMKQERNAD